MNGADPVFRHSCPRVLCALGLLCAQALSAAACSDVDLRPHLGEARDQGDTGWCFAHTAADLLTAAAGQRVSAMDVAVTYHLMQSTALPRNQDTREPLKSEDTHPDTFFEIRSVGSHPKLSGILDKGGDEDEALTLALARGLCLEAHLPSDPTAIIDHLGVLKIRYIENRSGGRPVKLRSPQSRAARKLAQTIWRFSEERCGPRVQLRKVAVKTYDIASDIDDLSQLELDRLRQRRTVLIATIDRVLSSGRPVAVGLDAGELTTPEWAAGEREHSVVIAGRKMIDGACHHFVRNSSGTDCHVFRDVHEPHTKCDAANGGLWITLESLSSIYSATWLDNGPVGVAGPG